MRLVDIILIILVLVAGLWIWKRHFSNLPEVAQPVIENPLQEKKNESVDLTKESRFSVLYQLPAKDQKVLVRAVEHFCVKSYHRDSCIHHLITCGVPCLVVIPKPRRGKIFADYQALRKSRNLPPLPSSN